MKVINLGVSATHCTNVFLLLMTVILQLRRCAAYECYVCTNQESNREKCIKTVKTCDITENACMSIVRWGSTPYWDPTGSKQYYVSKQCASSVLCDAMMQNISRRCDRIWYNDWECVECCTGDRCNYFVTLGTSSLHPMPLFTSMAVIAVAMLAIYNNLRV